MAFTSAYAASNTVTLPSHKAGDYIFVFACSPTLGAPTLGTGGSTFTNLQSQSRSGVGGRVGYLVAASGSETCGTWTNASHILAIVSTGQTAIGSSDNDSAPSTNTPYPNAGAGSALIYPGECSILLLGYEATGAGVPTAATTTIYNANGIFAGCTDVVSVWNGENPASVGGGASVGFFVESVLSKLGGTFFWAFP